jgi:hypothetical protein
MELTDDDRERILLEEKHRLQVRNELEKEKRPSSSSRFVAFLNTQLGIWLLTAIVVTGGGYYYTWRKETTAENFRIKDRIETLDIEIAYRLHVVLNSLFENSERHAAIIAQRSPDGPEANQLIAEDVAAMHLLDKSPADNSFPPLFPEYAKYNFIGLVAEERRLVPQSQRDELSEVLGASRWLLPYITPQFRTSQLSNPEIIAKYILHKLVRDRWGGKHNWFPFLDCTPEKPFC